jgi:hypothetical protein
MDSITKKIMDECDEQDRIREELEEISNQTPTMDEIFNDIAILKKYIEDNGPTDDLRAIKNLDGIKYPYHILGYSFEYGECMKKDGKICLNDIDENTKLEKKIKATIQYYNNLKSKRENAYKMVRKYDNVIQSCNSKRYQLEVDLLKLQTINEISLNEFITKEEADIIFYGMDKTDYSEYTSRKIPRFMDLEKIQNKIKNIKEINSGWKLIKLSIGSSQDSIPPCNSYIYVFEDTHGIKYTV